MLKEGKAFCYGGREIMSEKSIREVYGISVRIKEDQDGVWIIPAMPQGASDPSTGKDVHKKM